MRHTAQERRRQDRRRSYLGAQIEIDGMPSRTRCLLRDFHTDGARIVLSEAVPLPDAFDLHVDRRGGPRRMRMVWRRGESIGLAVVRPEPVLVSLDAMRDLRAMRAENADLRARLARLEAAQPEPPFAG